MMSAVHRHLFANGISLHVVEHGVGPLVVFCHGFPETSHVWRHQLSSIAAAGFHAVAFDLRGYGQSDAPASTSAFTTLDAVADILALIEALGERQAVLVGGDWGATIAWQAAQLHPDRIRAVVALGVPLMGRAPLRPSELFPKSEAAQFYTHYFAEPGVAEAELERDVADSLKRIYFAASGDAGLRDDPATPNPFGMIARGQGMLDSLPAPEASPAWLPAADLDLLVSQFKASGFRGGLNFYRNLDRNWEQQADLGIPLVTVPAMYLVGERDPGRAIPGMAEIVAAMPSLAPALVASKVVPEAGHWLQQEAPEAVNEALIEFLRNL